MWCWFMWSINAQNYSWSKIALQSSGIPCMFENKSPEKSSLQKKMWCGPWLYPFRQGHLQPSNNFVMEKEVCRRMKHDSKTLNSVVKFISSLYLRFWLTGYEWKNWPPRIHHSHVIKTIHWTANSLEGKIPIFVFEPLYFTPVFLINFCLK